MNQPNSDMPRRKSHPLDGVDDWECYDQHISERNRLITAKRESEDGFVRTIIQLSSGIILLIPGFLSATSPVTGNKSVSPLMLSGLVLIALGLLAALSEQYLSSLAYEKQIEKTDAYYRKISDDVTPPALSKVVRLSLSIAFVAFLLGLLVISSALIVGPWRS